MRAQTTLIALCAAGGAAWAQPAPRPSDAVCRAILDDGQHLARAKSYDLARERFHAARVRCANTQSLVLIARTYEEQGDLPRALAYLEAYLAAIDPGHESRAAMEAAAAGLRTHVPDAQRVSIAAELASEPATSVATVEPPQDLKSQLNQQVDRMNDPGVVGGSAPSASYSPRDVKPTIERASGFFVGANLAYATKAKVEIGAENMSGTVDFPSVFAAELQAGYRFFPFLSVALVPQMLFNLQPSGQDAATELEVFVQTTGHLVVARRWDFNLFAAPGYSVLFVPDADDARGLAFRWGGGPMFHLSKHVSFAAEFSHQIGFQGTERMNNSVAMETSFVSLLAGVRFRR